VRNIVFSVTWALGRVLLLSRWAAAGPLSTSGVYFQQAAEQLQPSRWTAYSAQNKAD